MNSQSSKEKHGPEHARVLSCFQHRLIHTLLHGHVHALGKMFGLPESYPTKFMHVCEAVFPFDICFHFFYKTKKKVIERNTSHYTPMLQMQCYLHEHEHGLIHGYILRITIFLDK